MSTTQYPCSDFYLSCYLRARFDLPIKEVKQEGSRKVFVFESNGSNVQDMIKGFYNGDDSVSANRFVREIKDLKTLMYNY